MNDLQTNQHGDTGSTPESAAESAAVEAHLRGDLEQAERLYRVQLAGGGKSDPAIWTNLGQLLKQANRHAEALACYQQAARLPNAPAATHFNMGNAYLASQEFARAEACYRQALAIDPGFFMAALQLARTMSPQARIEEALMLYQQLARSDPGNYSVWIELGNVQRSLGNPAAAAESYRACIRCAPDRWGAYASLARVLEEQGEQGEQGLAEAAEIAYRQALSLAPQRDAVHRMIGRARMERGDMEGALAAFQAIQQEGHTYQSVAGGLIDAGDVLMCMGRNEEALQAFTQAACAEDEATLVRLADVLFPHNLWALAVQVLQKVADLYPGNAYAYLNLAQGQLRSWLLEPALQNLDRAQELQPDINGVPPMRASIFDKLGDSESALRIYRELIAQEGALSRYRGSAAYCALYSEQMTPKQIMEFHRELFAPWQMPAEQRAASRARFANSRDARRRLRIAYMTADMHHQHPVNIFMQPVLAHHDASAVEVTLYYGGRAYDEQTRRAKTMAHRWRDIAGMSDERVQKLVAEDEIDILVDLAGHTGTNRMQLLARRLAPVQVTFLGYPHSTGVPEIDWLIGDPVVTPHGSEELCSERILRLPHFVFCYSPIERYPLPKFNRSGPIIFGSFNNINKVTERTVRLWSKVIGAVPGSRLLLKAPSFSDELAKKRYRELFAAHGIGAERLELRGPSGLAEMMAEYADVDIALDPLLYNGGTTSVQALWMGVPVVTLMGGNFAQRMGASALKQLGREEWVATDEESYIAIAAGLASDRKRLKVEKAGLRARMQASPLSDIAPYTRHLEAVLREAWLDYCENGGEGRN